MPTATISGKLNLPGDVLPADGDLYVTIAGKTVTDSDGSMRLDQETYKPAMPGDGTDADPGMLEVTLPTETTYVFTFISKRNTRMTSTHYLTEDTTWGALFLNPNAPGPAPDTIQDDIDSRLEKGENLADLTDVNEARDNLGLGTAATHPAGDFATADQGAKADTAVQPGGLTKAAVGLGNVTNDAQVPASLIDAKGDLLVGSGNDALGRLAAGTPGQALVADPAAALGLAWGGRPPIEGVGFPEGVITAAIGSRYIDTAATNGAVEWIKASGNGNTGWRVSEGAMTRKLADADLLNGWKNANVNTAVTLSRDGSLVILQGQMDKSAATSGLFLSLPAGLRPFTIYASGAAASNNSASSRLTVSTGGNCTINDMGGLGSSVTFDVVFRAPETWPTASPGSPI